MQKLHFTYLYYLKKYCSKFIPNFKNLNFSRKYFRKTLGHFNIFHFLFSFIYPLVTSFAFSVLCRNVNFFREIFCEKYMKLKKKFFCINRLERKLYFKKILQESCTFPVRSLRRRRPLLWWWWDRPRSCHMWSDPYRTIPFRLNPTKSVLVR